MPQPRVCLPELRAGICEGELPRGPGSVPSARWGALAPLAAPQAPGHHLLGQSGLWAQGTATRCPGLLSGSRRPGSPGPARQQCQQQGMRAAAGRALSSRCHSRLCCQRKVLELARSLWGRCWGAWWPGSARAPVAGTRQQRVSTNFLGMRCHELLSPGKAFPTGGPGSPAPTLGMEQPELAAGWIFWGEVISYRIEGCTGE